ncbi:MAG: helix-turn-helix domain-containing protein [Bacilli bacterium]|nr:helix-turn-helix domain-containing protein [Bacilli bacterium]MCQ2798536.1 helix-turn-helix domain-containing protein [Bacilli bacterium]
MSKRYFFHSGDFFKWYRTYIKCKRHLYDYRFHYTTDRRRDEKELYKESLQIVDEYKIYTSSLSEADKQYLEEAIKEGRFDQRLDVHPDVIDNWEEIVIKPGRHALTEVDIAKLGSKLKELRKFKEMYRADVCRYLGIAERTLQAYEEGDREISINYFYKLMQLYGVGDISDFLKIYTSNIHFAVLTREDNLEIIFVDRVY